MHVPVLVVTRKVPAAWADAHPDAPFTFVTDGVEAAVERAQAIANGRVVAVTAGTIAQRCLELDLLDEVAIDLGPVVMGVGRPFLGKLSISEVDLGDSTTCIQSDRVIHLRLPVRH